MIFFHILHRTMTASNNKTGGTDSDLYHYHTICSEALPFETQRDGELKQASEMLETTNNRKSFHNSEKLTLWSQRRAATYKNREWIYLSSQLQSDSYTHKNQEFKQWNIIFSTSQKITFPVFSKNVTNNEQQSSSSDENGWRIVRIFIRRKT